MDVSSNEFHAFLGLQLARQGVARLTTDEHRTVAACAVLRGLQSQGVFDHYAVEMKGRTMEIRVSAFVNTVIRTYDVEDLTHESYVVGSVMAE